MKNIYKHLICFIVPIIIFNICLIINNIGPFGDYIITVYDSHLQYPGFYLSLKNFHFYLFNAGFGFNFFSTAAYYLLSPLNILIFFFNNLNYNTFYYLLIILKIGLCSTSMFYFLKKIGKENIFTVIFSIIYSLIGYISSYYYNSFWIDCLIMLPLVLHGINIIIDKQKSLFYIITLALCIIFNFYIGYMVCLFSVIYFIYKLIETNNYKNKKTIKLFLISSILSAFICSIVLIPTFFALINGKATSEAFSYTKYLAFNENIKYFFYSLTPGNFHATEIAFGFGQNFCTLFVIINVILFFFNTKFSKKLKITTISIILFYLICYSFNLFDYTWQMFQQPAWWQHRYSFTLSFFLIFVAYQNIINFKTVKINNKQKIIIFLTLSFLILISFILFFNFDQLKNTYYIFFVIFSLLLIANYIFLLNPLNKKSQIIIIVFIMLELLLNTFVCVKENNRTNSLSYDKKMQKQYLDTINNIQKEDNTFYRLELLNSFSYNDGLQFNYNGINYFNSIRNQKVISTMNNYFNLKTNNLSRINLTQFDPYLLSLFNVKYLISEDNVNYYNKFNEITYQNKDYLPIGFAVHKSIKDIKLKKYYYQDNITTIYNSMLNEEKTLYHPVTNQTINTKNVTYSTNKYEKNDKQKEAKIIINFQASDDMLIMSRYKYFDSYSKVYINNKKIDIATEFIYANKNDEIRIENILADETVNEDITKLDYINIKELNDITKRLSTNSLKDIKIYQNNNLLEGNINVKDNNQILFTSIAYEEGMTIKVNNKKVDSIILLDCFTGIKLSKGNNNIVISYIPKGLKTGALLSILGILLTVIYTEFNKK